MSLTDQQSARAVELLGAWLRSEKPEEPVNFERLRILWNFVPDSTRDELYKMARETVVAAVDNVIARHQMIRDQIP